MESAWVAATATATATVSSNNATPPGAQKHTVEVPHAPSEPRPQAYAGYSDIAMAHRDLVWYYSNFGLLDSSTPDALFQRVFLPSIR